MMSDSTSFFQNFMTIRQLVQKLLRERRARSLFLNSNQKWTI
jgi:hypothetical protein